MAETFNWWVALSIMVSYILIDGLYVRYTLEVVELNPIRAANIGTIMHFLLAFGVISYTQNWLYVLPLALGSWIGTYLVVKHAKRKKENV